jgi:glycerate kinase
VKILVAPNAFKGTHSSVAVAQTWAGVLGEKHEIQTLALSDGGDGYLDAIHFLIPELSRRTTLVNGPYPEQRVNADWLWDASNNIAYIEVAQACGLARATQPLRALQATTYGVGELILAAQKAGAEDIYLGLGGTASTDAGAGALRALGWNFVNEAGRDIGQDLTSLNRMIVGGAKPPELNLMTDVTNPLLGDQGAALIFAPQKGATTKDVELLEARLAAFWLIARDQFNMNLSFPGSGAAGGLAAGLSLTGQAHLGSGFDLIADLGDLEDKMRWADLVVTGEGAFDSQSMMGKATGRVLSLAQSQRKKTAVISGTIAPGSLPLVDFSVALSGRSIRDGSVELSGQLGV